MAHRGCRWPMTCREVPTRGPLDPQDPNLLLVIASDEAHAQNMRAAGMQPPYSGPRWPWWFGSVAQVAA